MAIRPRVITAREFLSTPAARESFFTESTAPPQADGYFSRLTAYIPSEIVGAYVFIAGLIKGGLMDAAKEGAPAIHPKTFLGFSGISLLWASVIALTVISPFYMYLASNEKKRTPQWFQVCSSPFAFLTWAFALGGPFEIAVKDYNSAGSAVLLVIVSLVIPGLDKLLDLRALQKAKNAAAVPPTEPPPAATP